MVAVISQRPKLNGGDPVSVSYQSNELVLANIAGRNVATILIWCRDLLNVPRSSLPFVNGMRVCSLHQLLPGDRLEFVFPWGFKGGGDHLISAEELMAWRGVNADQYEQLRQRGLPFVRGKDGEVLHPRNAVKEWFSFVPPGAPKWITGFEIEDTLRVWQPSYPQLLTPDDALEILVNTRNLLDVLFPLGGDGKEAAQ
jgi:hypothetical protein